MARRRQVRHNLESLLFAAQLAAQAQPTARNRRRLRLVRQRFADRTTGCRNPQRWIDQ